MEGMIKLSEEDNLFYDSVERIYRYRMHCPNCGEVSGCRCFNTLEKAEDFIMDSVDFVCSNKCSLIMLIDEQGTDDIRDTMKEMGTKDWVLVKPRLKKLIIKHIINKLNIWRLKWYVFKYLGYISEKDAYKVLDTMEVDYDSVEGESC